MPRGVYLRVYSGARARAIRKRARPPVQRFWPRVQKGDGPNACWLWTGKPNAHGYGQIQVGTLEAAATQRTHIFAMELVLSGPVPEGWHVCHTCDVPLCVRNDERGTYEVNGIVRLRWGHLWLGTHADNMADMHAKDRAARDLGVLTSNARLDDDAVRRIRAEVAAGTARQIDLAAEYEVSPHQIWMIVHRRSWSHVV